MNHSLDYLEIVLNGYLNNNEYLERHYYREFKEAQKNYFEAHEFFMGCLNFAELFIINLQKQIVEEKLNQHQLISLAEYRVLQFSDEDPTKTYDERCEEIIKNSNYSILVEVDGGVNLQNKKSIIESGADILVIGSSLYNANNKKEFIEKIKE